MIWTRPLVISYLTFRLMMFKKLLSTLFIPHLCQSISELVWSNPILTRVWSVYPGQLNTSESIKFKCLIWNVKLLIRYNSIFARTRYWMVLLIRRKIIIVIDKSLNIGILILSWRMDVTCGSLLCVIHQLIKRVQLTIRNDRILIQILWSLSCILYHSFVNLRHHVTLIRNMQRSLCILRFVNLLLPCSLIHEIATANPSILRCLRFLHLVFDKCIRDMFRE